MDPGAPKLNFWQSVVVKHTLSQNIMINSYVIAMLAIQNIFDNAKRYASKIHVEISTNEEECFIAISDNGSGIPAKNYEDVFKPFFTLDPSRNKLKGESGLGLSITRDIIRSHGGEIKLNKSSIGGLKSSIFLPI